MLYVLKRYEGDPGARRRPAWLGRDGRPRDSLADAAVFLDPWPSSSADPGYRAEEL